MVVKVASGEAVDVPAQYPVPYTFLQWFRILSPFSVHMSMLVSEMSVMGTMSEPRITMGARAAPLSTVPVQLLNVRPLRATAPVSGVVCEYQYWSMSFCYKVS